MKRRKKNDRPVSRLLALLIAVVLLGGTFTSFVLGETNDDPADTVFSSMTVEEQYNALFEMSDEEISGALSQLTEEQYHALEDYVIELESSKQEPIETVVFTEAGPFMPAVSVVPVRRLMKAGSRGAGESSPDGLELNKQFTDNGDGTYTITLESYTTGDVISTEVSTPVDIVLVLDQSGSMAYDFDGDTSSYANSRQKAMKDAVANFISNVHDKFSDSADHRISIVTFGSNASDLAGWTAVDNAGFTSLSNAVNGLPTSPSGATNAGAAMGRAQHLVTDEYSYTGSNTDRQKVVVVFTDGVPTTGSTFSTGVANGALNAAANIKAAGATIYSVGIFTGANPSELYGASGHFQNSNGTVGSYWADASLLIFGDVEHADVPAGNRFLNYLSSNFGGITSIGLTRNNYNIIIAQYTRYTITQNYSRINSNYYLTANNASSLDDIFQSIAEQIVTPAIDLGSETVVKDIIAPQLQIPEGSTVRFYTQNSTNGTDGWGTKTEITDGSVHLVPSGDDSTVSVSGFDYNANCVTEELKEDGTHGKKLIIEITVEPGPDFLGGTIDTNGPDSGIYPDGSTTPIGTFPVPDNAFTLKPITPEDAERNIYLSTEDQLAESFSSLVFTIGGQEISFNNLFNGINNAGVDYELMIMDGDDLKGTYRIPAGKTPSDPESGWAGMSAPVLPAKAYTIDSIVSDKTCPPWDPRLDPEDPAYDPNAPKPQVMEGHIDLHVFNPILTYADKNVYYAGNQINVENVTPDSVVWKFGNTLDTAVTMDTVKPTLTYTYSGVTGTTVDQNADYTVAVTTVKNGNVDLLTQYEGGVSFLRDCAVENIDDGEASAEEAFKIHVYMPSFEFVDMTKYYGEEITLPTSYTPTWKNSNGDAAPSTMDNTAPELIVTPTPASGAVSNGVVSVASDFDVAVSIKAGNTDITSSVIGSCTRTCDTETGTLTPTAAKAYVVHVKTLSVIVDKKISGKFADLTKKYNFIVGFTPAKNGGPGYTAESFELGNLGSKTLEGLPLGTITITESGVPEGYKVTFTVDDTAGNAITPNNGSASSEGITLGTNHTDDEVKVTVTNTYEDVPPTAVVDGLSGLWGVFTGIGGIASLEFFKRKKRNSVK